MKEAGRFALDSQGLISQGRELPTRLRNGMETVAQRSELTVIVGEFDGNRLSKHYLASAIGRVKYIPSENLIAEAQFYRGLPAVAGALVSSEPKLKEESYVSAIGGEDMQNLPQIAVDIASKGGRDSKSVMRIVYGASEKIPFRALSYMLPCLVMMEHMQKNGVDVPQLQVVFAFNTPNFRNGFDHRRVSQQARLFVSVVRGYVGEFFPNLSDKTVFLEDSPISQGSGVAQEYDRLTEALKQNVSGILKEKLLKKGIDPSFEKNIAYGAAHVLFHDAALEGLLWPLTDDHSEMVHPHTIINIGGHQEKDFYILRNHLKSIAGIGENGVRTLQLFSRHRVPPYYMARGGDVLLEDVVRGRENYSTEIAETALYDLKYFKKVSDRRGDTKGFIRNLSYNNFGI